MLPHELFVHIASFCKVRTISSLSQTCKALAILAKDESLHRHLVLTRYNPNAVKTHLSWKTLFRSIWCLRRRIANKPVKGEERYPMSYDVFKQINTEADENVGGGCNCISHFGYNVLHKRIIDYSQNGSLVFIPFHLPPDLRKIHLYHLNFENRLRQIKAGIEYGSTTMQDAEKQLSDAFPPFTPVMIIADGLCVWQNESRKYVLVYEMAKLFKHFQQTHAPKMGERIALLAHAE